MSLTCAFNLKHYLVLNQNLNMINKNEIRIGNKLLFDSDIDTVTSIYGNGVDGEFKSRWWFDRLHGIRLTPELFIKCGFKKEIDSVVWVKQITYDDDKDYKYSCTLQNYDGTDHISICRGGVYSIAPTIKYLHQLQNLIFVLTGEDLTINI